jgi:hypothetical protein
MSSSANETEYLKFLTESVEWYRRHANKAMVLFILVRLVLTVLSASLPAFSTLGLGSQALSIAAVTIAVLAALDTQFKWGDEWRQYRTTQMAVQRLHRMYVQGAIAPGKPQDERIHELVRQAEEVIASDADKFFTFRIAAWKEPT